MNLKFMFMKADLQNNIFIHAMYSFKLSLFKTD